MVAMVVVMLMLLVTSVFGFVSIPITRMQNAVHVYPPGTATGLTLQDAYDYLISSDRDARMGTIGVLNRRTLILTPGTYTSTEIVLSEDYVDIEGIGLVIITDTSGVVIDCDSKITRISNITIDGSSIANCLDNDSAAVCQSVSLTDGTNLQILVDGLSGAITIDQTNSLLNLGASAVMAANQILMNPVADAVGTVEGTIYYDSDTDILNYRDSGAWVPLPGSSTAGGTDTQIQYNNGGTALGGIASVLWDDTNFIFADELGVAWGSGVDYTITYDENVDDQLLIETAAVDAGAVTDPMVELLVDTGHANGTSLVATQQVFGIAKGTQASNVSLFTIDAEGDAIVYNDLAVGGTMTVTGAFYQADIAAAASGNTNLTINAGLLGSGTITIGNSSTGKITTDNLVDLLGHVNLGDTLASDTLSILAKLDQDLYLDDDTTHSPALVFRDTGEATCSIVKLNGATADTTVTIAAASDFSIRTGNLSVGDGSSAGTAAMDGEDFYVAGDSEFDGAVQFDGLPTGAAGLTITGAAVNLNVSSNFAANIATGTSTGTVTLGGNGIQAIAIGNGAAAKTVALGSSNSTSTTTLLSGSGGLLLNVTNNQPTNINTGTSTGDTTIGNALSEISMLGHIQGTVAFVLDGSTDDEFDVSISVTDPTADITWTLPDGAALTLAFMGSTLATNYPGVANSVTGGTNQLIFEGSDADTEEHIIQATDPTADIIWILADGPADSLAIIGSTLITNNTEIANSIWGGTNQLIFEGSDADTEELVITVEDPTADNTYTFSDDTGSVAYTPTGGTTKDNSDAALPITHGYVAGTSGAASAWTLPNGNPGQILTVAIITDVGVATITPATPNSGWATCVLTDDGDTVTFLYLDDTAGWVITGMIGITGQPVITQ